MVHIFDQDSLKLQTIHSTISDQLQELKEQDLLSESHQLKVSGNKLIHNHERIYACQSTLVHLYTCIQIRVDRCIGD